MKKYDFAINMKRVCAKDQAMYIKEKTSHLYNEEQVLENFVFMGGDLH